MPSLSAAFFGANVVTCPSKRKMLPWTTGFPRFSHLGKHDVARIPISLCLGERGRRLHRKAEILPSDEARIGALDVRVTELAQCGCGERAANAARAVRHDLRVLVGHALLDLHLEKSTRDRKRTGHVARPKLLFLANAEDGVASFGLHATLALL